MRRRTRENRRPVCRYQLGGYGPNQEEQLPPEIVSRIGSYLSSADLVRAQRSSRGHFFEHNPQISRAVSSELLENASTGRPARPPRPSTHDVDPISELLFEPDSFDSVDEFSEWIRQNFSADALTYPGEYGRILPALTKVKRILRRNLSFPRDENLWYHAKHFGRYLQAFAAGLYIPVSPLARHLSEDFAFHLQLWQNGNWPANPEHVAKLTQFLTSLQPLI